MIHEDMAVAAITKDGAAEFPNIRRCLDPTRCLRVEISKLLQRSILSFRHELDAHGSSHIHHQARLKEELLASQEGLGVKCMRYMNRRERLLPRLRS